MDAAQAVANLSDRMESLVMELIEIEAIKQLKARYFRLMDTKHFTPKSEAPR